MSARPALIVIAKDPVPGLVKTRLSPPLRPEEAAELAFAALEDTLASVAAVAGVDRVLALAGSDERWRERGFEIVRQRGDGLADRLAAAFADVGGPALLIGMDTPQLTRDDLVMALAQLADHDSVLGPAADGGFWAIGLQAPDPAVFAGIPMSSSTTGRAQLDRLRVMGHRTALLGVHRDVDTWDDALDVAALAPGSAFARAVGRINDRSVSAR